MRYGGASGPRAAGLGVLDATEPPGPLLPRVGRRVCRGHGRRLATALGSGSPRSCLAHARRRLVVAHKRLRGSRARSVREDRLVGGRLSGHREHARPIPTVRARLDPPGRVADAPADPALAGRATHLRRHGGDERVASLAVAHGHARGRLGRHGGLRARGPWFWVKVVYSYSLV